MSDTLLEADLITRSLAGDSRAFSTLCDCYRTRVWRIIASVAQGPDVDDLAQEAVLRAWSGLRSWRGEAPFEAWLCRIALHAARDYQRSAWKRRVTLWAVRPESAEEGGGTCEPADEAALRRDLQRRVRQAVAALPARQSAPVWLHYFEGFSLAEVARLEGVPESTVRSRLAAGLKRLSRVLRDLPGEDQEIEQQRTEPAFARADSRVDRFARIERESKGCNP